MVRCTQCSLQTLQKPLQPFGYVECILLGVFEYVIIGISFFSYLGTHAVKAMMIVISPRQLHICYRTCYAAIAIIKRMNGHKP